MALLDMKKAIKNIRLEYKLFFLFVLSSLLAYPQMSIDSLIEHNYSLNKASINTSFDEYGVFVYKDLTYYTSNKKTRSYIQYRDKKTKNYFDNIFSVSSNFHKKIIISKPISGNINTKLNESFPVLTKDGKTMYYTANLIIDGQISNQLYLLRAHLLENNEWGNIENLSINSSDYSNAQAVLNNDETRLYFVSDRYSKGKNTDIYFVDINSDGTFGQSTRLGRNINSNGNEVTPFISEDNILYFSSNGHKPSKDMDVYFVNLNLKGSKPVNLGKSINTTFDDFSYSIYKNSTGFISSNKEGNFNVYHVKEKRTLRKIIEQIKNDSIKNAFANRFKNAVRIENGVIKSSLKINSKTTSLNLEDKNFLNFIIKYIRKNPEVIFDVNSVIVSEEGNVKELNKKIKEVVSYLNERNMKYTYQYKVDEKTKKEEEQINDKGIVFYFDHNSSYLNKDSKKSLNILADYLIKNRNIKINLSTHADSRGTNAYNMYLTEKRLNRVIEYLKKKKVNANQIFGKSFGEEKITNKCINDVICSASEHKLNRRVNYILIDSSEESYHKNNTIKR